ncbi:hypothetical protein ACFO3O_01790 [Dokdonia ponticola]|uniref:PRMT5 arginine-N-methyltransferase domain-containing protein n=1 Tax=Dokdonia ponticola TaxID=2041041 RepID=A0ABV9HR22_9FLAO
MHIQKELIQATSEYFEDTIDQLKLLEASKKYKAILHKISSQKIDTEEGRIDIENKNGKSLGTFWAGLCLDDILRTRQFIKGIDNAIKDLKKRNTIHVLYAGTGPFATLILPIMLRYSNKNISYTLLEINPFTFNILENVITALELEDYDITLVKDDATRYVIDPKNKPDIIISETMQSALAKEQQVPIFLNLMRQVSQDTVFIPEKIALHLALKKAGTPDGRFLKQDYTDIEKIFEVSKASMFDSYLSEKQGDEIEVFSKKKTIIKEMDSKTASYLLLNTYIQVYDDVKIDVNESGLTTPLILRQIPNDIKSTITIDTQYVISSEPRLAYQIILNATEV